MIKLSVLLLMLGVAFSSVPLSAPKGRGHSSSTSRKEMTTGSTKGQDKIKRSKSAMASFNRSQPALQMGCQPVLAKDMG